MTTTRYTWMKKGTSALMATALICNMGAFQAFAAGTETGLESQAGRYTVPIQSLVSSAPLPAVQQAFSGAFGDSVVVTVHEDGSKTALIENYHMVIDLFGSKYDANVSSIVDADKSTEEVDAATVLSTKSETYTPGMGASENISIIVPEQWEIPLQLDGNNAQQLSITVDFMDAFLGGGKPYPTTVTLTLDMDAAKIDTSELQALVDEYMAISGENYTEVSFARLTDAIEKAKVVAENPKSMEELNAMIEELKAAKDGLVYKGADYSAVNTALAKIPADSSIYTKESWSAVEAAKNAVVNGLDVTKQAEVDAYAAAIEAAIAALVFTDADYTLVDQAIASVPEDLSGYTDVSVQGVKDAVAAVVRGLKANEQQKVNQMAADISKAVAALEKKSTQGTEGGETTEDTTIDLDNLQDGTYEIALALWNSTQDKASMAASSLNGTARIVVKNGIMTVYIYTKPMTFGSITASLQEMKVEQSDGSWVEAVVETKSSDGNPTCFSFSLDQLQEYVNVKVNPHVEMMGNQDLDARLKFNLDSIKLVSSDTQEVPVTPPADTQVPQTGDSAQLALWIGLLALSLGSVSVLMVVRRRSFPHSR